MTEERKWLNFYYAVQEVRERLKVSDGEARRLLRECRSVKTQRQPYDPQTGQDLEPPERLTSKHWRDDDMDLARDEDGTPYFVDVDEADFRFWLDNLPKVKPRAMPKVKLAQLALAALDLPADTPNPEAEKRVNDWLKDNRYPTVSKSTVVRARQANKLMN
jgi:hypothetical protein